MSQRPSDVVVVGSGGAGMMAALRFYVDCERPDSA